MRRACRGTMCSENWRCFRGSINYVTTEDRAVGGKWGRGGERARKMTIRRICMTARVLRVYTRWSKSTVLEARDIRSPGVIDTESRHGVQLDAPVILDSPLIYGLRRERKAIRIAFEFNERYTARRDCTRSIQMLCEMLIKLFD